MDTESYNNFETMLKKDLNEEGDACDDLVDFETTLIRNRTPLVIPKMFPVESSLANFTIFLNERHKYLESFYPQIDQMDFYRFVNLVKKTTML